MVAQGLELGINQLQVSPKSSPRPPGVQTVTGLCLLYKVRMLTAPPPGGRREFDEFVQTASAH